MNRTHVIQQTIAILAVTGVLAAAPVQAQRTAKIEGLEKIEKIDLQRLALSRFRATGKSALSDEQVHRHAEELVYATDADIDLDKPEVHGDAFVFSGRKDPSAALDIDARTGDLSFSSGLARYSDDGDTPDLPPLEIAAELALDQIAGVGLLPDERQLVVAHVGGLNMSARDEEGKTADFSKLVTVHFARELDGMAVHGASRMVVHLAEHGRLQGLVRRWVDVEGERIGAGEVLDRGALMDATVRAFGETSADATSIVLETAEVVLYDDGRGIIEPAVRVTATRRYADRRLGAQPLDFYVPAMWKPAGSFPTIYSRNVPEK